MSGLSVKENLTSLTNVSYVHFLNTEVSIGKSPRREKVRLIIPKNGSKLGEKNEKI